MQIRHHGFARHAGTGGCALAIIRTNFKDIMPCNNIDFHRLEPSNEFGTLSFPCHFSHAMLRVRRSVCLRASGGLERDSGGGLERQPALGKGWVESWEDVQGEGDRAARRSPGHGKEDDPTASGHSSTSTSHSNASSMNRERHQRKPGPMGRDVSREGGANHATEDYAAIGRDSPSPQRFREAFKRVLSKASSPEAVPLPRQSTTTSSDQSAQPIPADRNAGSSSRPPPASPKDVRPVSPGLHREDSRGPPSIQQAGRGGAFAGGPVKGGPRGQRPPSREVIFKGDVRLGAGREWESEWG